MGVRSLLGFVEGNASELLVSVELNGLSLVIDGYNILHELYYLSPADTSFGGDYDLFSKSVEKFCNKLKESNVAPYFVFDGASELNDTKLKTTLERAQERIHLAGLSSHRKRTKILPSLAFRAFVDKLRELAVPYCVCDHEADQQLASLVSQWKCPLVSNDSDFLLHDLSGGVISVNNFNVQDIMEGSGSDDGKLYAKIYYVRNLLEVYRIKQPSIITLLAVICGNDSFPNETMASFRRSINQKQNSIDISKYLKWLSKFDDLESAVNDIIKRTSRSVKLREKILQTVEAYNISTNHISGYFLSDRMITHDSSHPLHKSLPELFWSRYRSALVSKRLMEVFFFSRRIFAVQMEDLSYPSAWLCSADIRTLTYRIISASNTTSIPVVREYDRKGKRLIPRLVTVEFVGVDKSCLSLDTLYKQSEEHRLCLFYKACGITEEMMEGGVVTPSSPEGRDTDILTAMVLHWIHHCQPFTCKIYVMAILVCIVNLSLIDELLSEQERVCRQIQKHAHVPTQDQKHELGLEMPALHAMAQFQAVVSDGLDLLGLLGVDLNIHIHEIFSGRYVYNLAIELSSRLEPSLYCQELLVRGSDYSNLFKSWYTLIEENVSAHCLTVMGNSKVSVETVTKAAKKRAKRQAQRNRDVSPVRDEVESDGDEMVDQLLDNRFAALSIINA